MTVLDAARFIWEHLQRRRGVFLAVAVLVVFVTTYLLILPAISLDKDKAAEQGGIDVPATEQALEDSESGDKGDPADADAAKAGQGEAKAGQGDVDLSEDGEPAEIADEEDAEKADPYFDGALKFKGDGLKVTVSAEEDACIPSDAELAVSEINEDSRDYQGYAEETAEALGTEAGQFTYEKFLDISILYENEEVQPAAPVDVKIRMLDREPSKNVQVVHFGETIEVINDVEVDGDTVCFKANGFSAYAIVEGPESTVASWKTVTTLEEFKTLASDGLYVGHSDKFYFTNELYNVNNTSRTGILKTQPESDTPPSDAVLYYFEQVDGTQNQFYAYCYDKDGVKQYVRRNDNSLLFTKNNSEKMAFTIAVDSDGKFTVKNGNYYWNEQGEKKGKGFAAYNVNNDGSKLNFWYQDFPEDDPCGLDGKTYGLMNWNGGVAGKAVMGASSTAGVLDAKTLTVMSKAGDVDDRLFVPNDSDISMWTFTWSGNENKYYISTTQDGSTKYLKLDDGGASLVSEQTAIHVIPGTGVHKGEICLKSGDHTLTFSGNVDTGFNVNESAGAEWLNLVELSELTSDYVKTYTATKVSVSDPSITNGSQIIVYTRSWNEQKKRYDLYAINSDGSLIPVYESGDSIQWVQGQLNTLLWDFQEHYWEGTTEPNYFYDLYNEYSGKYIAPQVSDEGQILQDDPIGINLNGRRNGQYYSSILAWDEDSYTYAGYKVENGRIVPCPKSEAMDFYFAIMEDPKTEDELHTVRTVDHTKYGVTMKMYDLTSRTQMGGYLDSDQGGTTTNTVPNLLSTDLKSNGYPVTQRPKSGGSLGGLFAQATDTKTVNHLFIESTYNATGYFEFDSSQNFASLQEEPGNEGIYDFKVYKELGAYDTGTGPTRKHGQFFPYNDIEAGHFCVLNSENLYDVAGKPLPDSDPRKGELLHNLEKGDKKVDPYFAMELEASFTQTPSGKDAWGHDIIFEFTGDDDFWLYVDGELVIDLGGIHSALPGYVNFSTGEVMVNGKKTTLKQVFEDNYRARGISDDDIPGMINEIFIKNDQDQYIFKDYSTHSMKIFFMERGAGASNLHMRFNLASVKPGTVEMGKEVLNKDNTLIEDPLAKFPYQIWYKKENGQEVQLTQDNSDIKVTYKDTITPVPSQNVTIDGITYTNAFLLKPGEIAVIDFPDDAISYRIVECGVNTDVYNSVSVKEKTADGDITTTRTQRQEKENRSDYGIEYASTKDRPLVTWQNKVNEDALRTMTVTKKLFRENGTTPITAEEDPTTFTFRLYMATELDSDLEPANMQTYYVKDPNDNYCKYVKGQGFVSLGKSTFSELSDEEKKAATFTTSMNGSISKIPSGYTVEVREVLAGTRYKIVERPGEIPDGYSFQRYAYDPDVNEGGKNPEAYKDGSGQSVPAAEGVSETIVSGKDPHTDIRNIKGWGLRMYKEWSDQDYMSDRDPTYFAVYIQKNHPEGNGDGNVKLVLDTVRQLKFGDDPQTLYWYFNSLEPNTNFSNYIIREVRLTGHGWTVNEDGTVTGIHSNQVHNIHEEKILKLNGTQKGETESDEFRYTVEYEQGQTAPDSNVRVDTIKNERPGILLTKTEWNGETALAGATFKLTYKDEHDNDIEIGTFTSDEEGLITEAFLRDNIPYTLRETETPQGWHGVQEPIIITQSQGSITVSGDADPSYYVVNNQEHPSTLTVKDRPYNLQAIKIDGKTQAPLTGVTFSLHKQITVGEMTAFDTNPMPGYESLITDVRGIVPKIDNTLPPGTYQLREKSLSSDLESAGYQKLSFYIEFEVSKLGTIRMLNDPVDVSLTANEEGSGPIEYEMVIRNYIESDLMIHKVDESGASVTGAKFSLCIKDTSWEDVEGYEEIDMSSVASSALKKLSPGLYRLEETEAPAGYIIENKYTYFQIAEDRTISLTDEAGTGGNANDDATINETTITITNHAGAELPSSGGPGTTWIYLLGAVLLLGCSITLIARRRSRVG